MNNENFDLVTSDENEEFAVEFGEVINDGGTFDYNELENKPKINGNTVEGNKTTSELGIPVYRAGENITISDDYVISATGGGGTSDYEDLNNLPKVNDVTLTGNKSLSDLGIQPAGNYALESEIPDVSNFITKSVNDLVNYYKKTETFTKQEVNNLISAITTMDIQVVQTLPTEDISTTTIYLVPKTTAEQNDAYDEYIYVSSAWEHIGSTDIDLSGYQTKIDSSHKLSSDLVDDTNKTNKFVTAAEKTKLSSIATGAEVNVQANWNETNTSSDAYIQNKPNLSAKEDTSNKVTSLSSSSTDTQYPSAKLMYDNLYSITSDNKFDNSYDETGKLDVTTGEDLSATTYNRTNFRDLGKTITGNLYVTISETTSNFIYVCYYDENKVFLKGRTIWEASAADTYEDYVEGARYFRISVKNTWQGDIYISYVYNGVDTATYEYTKKIFNIDDVKKPLDERIVINFGDSIFGKRRPPNDISTTIEEITGATTYNCGFGGLTAGTHYSELYDPFALHSLADSIYSGDWSVQDAAVTAGAGVIPDYFADTVDLLESLDFTKVDMITIAYGTNDWNNGMAMDNPSNNKDITTYAGALRYSIEKILAVYPHIKIFLCTPIFRVMLDSSYVVTGDSDTATNINGKKLTDFIEKLKAVALEYHLTYIDNYYGLGINIKNWLYYFKNTDGTHPIYTGCHLIAENMSHYLIGDYTAPSIKVKSENSTTAGEVYDVTYINTMIGDVESILTTLTTGSGV